MTVDRNLVANAGLWKDIWTIPFDRITQILQVSNLQEWSVIHSDLVQIYYFDELLYLGSLMMIRLSVLCFYLRIFPQETFRKIVHVVIAVNILYSTAFIIVSILQCIPIHAAWERWDGTIQAVCVDINGMGWASGVIQIFLDVTVLVLPLPLLANLMMSWQRKAHLLVVFCLGILCVA